MSNLLWAYLHRGTMPQLPPQPKPSGVPGVTWSKDKQRWIARIFRNNKHYSAGTHETLEGALAARDRKLTELAKLDRSV